MDRLDFRKDLDEFQRKGNYALVIALGAGDLMIYPKETELCSQVREMLLSKNPDIKIKVDKSKFPDVEYLRRSNVAYTRKKIMPLVKEAIGECK